MSLYHASTVDFKLGPGTGKYAFEIGSPSIAATLGKWVGERVGERVVGGSPETEQEEVQVPSLNAKHSKVHEDEQAQVPPPVATQEEEQALSVPTADTQAGVQVEVQPQDVAASVKATRRHSRSDVAAMVPMMVEEEETMV